MGTWVLVVILLSAPAGQSIGVTSVPGYENFRDCEGAGEATKLQLSNKGLQIEANCIPGPKK